MDMGEVRAMGLDEGSTINHVSIGEVEEAMIQTSIINGLRTRLERFVRLSRELDAEKREIRRLLQDATKYKVQIPRSVKLDLG